MMCAESPTPLPRVRAVLAPGLTRLALSLGLMLATSATCAEELFLPNTLPLSESEGSRQYQPKIRILCNQGLLESAEMLRSNEMIAEHRALNHQWLQVHSGEGGEVEGSKVFSKIAKQTFREYWRDNRQQLSEQLGSGAALLPDDRGDLSPRLNEVDYGFKFSSRGLRIGFEYEFQ